MARGVAAGCRVIHFALNHHRVAVRFGGAEQKKRRCQGVSFGGGVGAASHPLPGWEFLDRRRPRSIREGYPIERNLFFFFWGELSSARRPVGTSHIVTL